MHTERRKKVERFLRAIGIPPAQSSSRNLLERPWLLTLLEFRRRCRQADPALFGPVHEQTAALSEQIAKFEQEIDERVAALYGLD